MASGRYKRESRPATQQEIEEEVGFIRDYFEKYLKKEVIRNAGHASLRQHLNSMAGVSGGALIILLQEQRDLLLSQKSLDELIPTQPPSLEDARRVLQRYDASLEGVKEGGERERLNDGASLIFAASTQMLLRGLDILAYTNFDIEV